jgi:carbonic anhydrase/acetyltransferase-like protein (isoleucine patch superfamily)
MDDAPMLIEYKGKAPVIGRNVYIAPTATIIGDVTIGDGSSVWFGAVIRGDLAPISIGKNTNIQDNCTLHVDLNTPAVIGNNVTVGHNAVVHGCTVEDKSLIGINAVLLNHARIRSGSIVAAGAVVKEGQTVGPDHLVAGIPAAYKKNLTDASPETFSGPVEDYLSLSRHYRSGTSKK